jgi:hypothetical protein
MDAALFRREFEAPGADPQVVASALQATIARIDEELPTDAVTAQERAWIRTSPGALEQVDHLNITWLVECETVFLWALGRCELPAFDRKTDVGSIADLVPLPGSPFEHLLRSDLARTEQETLTVQKLYETVLWRLRTPPESGAKGLALHVREVLDAAGVALMDGDIPLRGSPAFRYGSEDDTWRECHSIALERLRALRWLTSDVPWDQIDTEVRWPSKSEGQAQGELNIQKLVNELGDGLFNVRTNGLRAHRHPELDIDRIPFSAVEAAAKLIDYVIDAVIGKGAQLKAGENVGIPLSIAGHEEIPAVFVGVHASECERPSGGFIAKMRGAANYGVLRLADLPGSRPEPPLDAIATMMLYRANCRYVVGDVQGALQELRESIRLTPGDPNAGSPPWETPADSTLNWQNHLTYLRLAELADADERTSCYRQVFSRFTWLARRELGCSPQDIEGIAQSVLFEDAKNILAVNMKDPGMRPGPHAGLRFVARPLWTAGTDGNAVREASLIPAGFVDYCFGVRLASPDVADAVAHVAARCVARNAAALWDLASMTNGARAMYAGAPIAPRSATGFPYRPWHFLLSAVIAEAARYVYAGATVEELHLVFGPGGDDAQRGGTLKEKMAALESWETRQYTAGLFGSVIVN